MKQRVGVVVLLAVIVAACGVTACKAYRWHAGSVTVANDVADRPTAWTVGERLSHGVARLGRMLTPKFAQAKGAEPVAYYLYYQEVTGSPGVFEWVLDTAVWAQGMLPVYNTASGASPSPDSPSPTDAWIVSSGVAPAPTVSASGAGYLVASAGTAAYNGQYEDNGNTCNGQPVYELGSGFFVKMGADAAAQTLWDDAAKHKWSKLGRFYGHGYDVDAGATLDDPTVTVPAVITMPAGTSCGSSLNPIYRIRIKCAGAVWGEQMIYGTFPTLHYQGFESYYHTGDMAERTYLPYSEEESDAWDTLLGSAGAKTCTIELVRNTDDAIMASDDFAFTMFIPEVVISEPSDGGTVPDVFDIEFSLSEWYAPTATTNWALHLTPDGEGGIEETTWAAGNATGTIAGEIDLQFLGLYTVDPGDFELAITATRSGVFTTSESRITGSIDLTHVDTYDIEISTPGAGATVSADGIDVAATLVQGWTTYGFFKWYMRVDSAWVLQATLMAPTHWLSRTGQAVPPAPGYLVPPNDTDGLRIVWVSETDVTLATDEIAITVAASTAPPPDPDPDPDPYTTPTLKWVLPPNSGTVADDFTGQLSYGGFTAGTGHLQIVAVGAATVTLYDEDVALAAAGGTYAIALDFLGAAEGAYTLFATLTYATYSESASDAVAVTLASAGASDDPPTVEITAPLTGASVSGSVAVTVEATDDVAVYSVVLYVDGVAYQRLDAPNSGTDYLFTWDSIAYANGSHLLMAKAWDSSLQTDTDSITVTLVNAQADLERVLFTKQLGYSGGSPLNTESNRFRDRDFKKALMVVQWPDAADLPSDPRNLYNVFCGYHVPGTATDFDDFTLISEGQAFVVPTGNRTIRFAMKAVPQRTVAYWEVSCAQAIRIAANSDGDPLFLCTTPHSVQRLSRQSGELLEFADLSTLASAPVDMTAAAGKVFVAYADRVLVLDEDDSDLGFELLLPWTDGITAITALATDGSTVWIAADLDAGGSAVYEYTYPSATLAASHTHSITAMQYMLSGLYVGNDNGDVLQLGSGALSLLYATAETSVTRFGVNSQTLYAGTGNDGKVFYRPASWGASWDAGWTVVGGIAVFDGYAYAGGTGIGGTYLWHEAVAGAWAQTVNLDNCTQVNDLLSAVNSTGHEQLFVATTGIAGTTRLYRIEKGVESGNVCDVDPPHFVAEILRD